MQKYHFLYDSFGNTTSIGIGGWNSAEQITLASYEYAAMNGLLTRQTYGNGDKVEFTYDILGRAKTTTYKDENNNVDRVLTYVYTGDGQLYSIHDSRTGFLYLYTYDSIGRLIASSVKNADGEVLMSTRQEYNANNQLVGQHWTVGSTSYSETYTYSKTDGALTEYSNALGEYFTFNYDELRRLSSVVGSKYTKSYDYRNISTTNTTSQVASLTYSGFANAPAFGYTYDTLGNLSRYTDLSGTQIYTYDAQNQLTEVKDADGNVLYQYSYDNAGNILSANGHTYAYSNGLWKDQLSSFDGVAFEYDAIGNPTNYYNGTSYTFAWEEGRNLVSAVSVSNTYTYAYDSNGLRTSKTVNGVIHNYLYASGKLLRETYGSVILDFVYGQGGHPYALIYNNGTTTQTYYYITNLQGDVMYLLNTEKQQVASYSYDPYGRILTATGEMANINPIRYRGYYYDVETGFYYLQSRYYDPAICRFVNSDTYTTTGQGISGYNMYAYCNNNPICRFDYAGRSSGVIGLVIALLLLLTGCDDQSEPEVRADLANAPDLDISTAPSSTYNCYGNAIKKQIDADPTGYNQGDSTAKTFEAVQKDLGGKSNCIKLDSIDSPVEEGWYKVAMMCGDKDYHFIRLDENGWYNKSGNDADKPGCYISEAYVRAKVWWPAWSIDGVGYVVTSNDFFYYDKEGPIFFAVREGWDES